MYASRSLSKLFHTLQVLTTTLPGWGIFLGTVTFATASYAVEPWERPGVEITVEPAYLYSIGRRFPDQSQSLGTFPSPEAAVAAWAGRAQKSEYPKATGATLGQPLGVDIVNGRHRRYSFTVSYVTDDGVPYTVERQEVSLSLACLEFPGGWTSRSIGVGSDAKVVCSKRYATPEPNTCPASNPVFPESGLKMQKEPDYVDPHGLLSFTRVWRSDKGQFFSVANAALIDNTRVMDIETCFPGAHVENRAGTGEKYVKHSCYRYVRANVESGEVQIIRPDGQFIIYSDVGSGTIRTQADSKQPLARISDGGQVAWQFRPLDGSIEHYDVKGKLIKKLLTGGRFVDYTYSTVDTDPLIAPGSGMLLKMADNYGRSLSITYNASGRVAEVTDPAGEKIRYQYGELSADCSIDSGAHCQALTSVTYQDGKTRRYHYNEPGYVAQQNPDYSAKGITFLTGLTDENGNRLSHYKYDSFGRAVVSGWGNNLYEFQYDSAVTIIDPAKSARTVTYQTILNSKRVRSQTQPAGSGCAAADKSMTYDGNGNLKTSLDWNGRSTTYNYDLVRNLETSRTEAAGTPAARIISTEWHPTLRLAKRIAEPKRLTTYEYDASGNITTTSVQATSDATGAAAFTATKVGTARVSTNAYNAQGMLWTVTGPRIDVPDVTTYLYDTSGNLESVTNAAGHRTRYSNYDVHGHARRITAANGVITDREFGLRGWLDAETVSAGGISKRTAYTYDGVGQVKKVELPDGGAMNYTYDNEHRLTGIADNRGNSVTYELDPMGNRKSESVKDPTGTLTRQVARTFDALNRVKTQTGVSQ